MVKRSGAIIVYHRCKIICTKTAMGGYLDQMAKRLKQTAQTASNATDIHITYIDDCSRWYLE